MQKGKGKKFANEYSLEEIKRRAAQLSDEDIAAELADDSLDMTVYASDVRVSTEEDGRGRYWKEHPDKAAEAGRLGGQKSRRTKRR